MIIRSPSGLCFFACISDRIVFIWRCKILSMKKSVTVKTVLRSAERTDNEVQDKTEVVFLV